MIRINIKSSDFDTKSGTSKRGQAYSIREQIGYAQIGDEVRKVKISLGRDQPVYPVGLYIVDDASFTTDSYDGLTLGRLVLKLAVAAQAKAVA